MFFFSLKQFIKLNLCFGKIFVKSKASLLVPNFLVTTICLIHHLSGFFLGNTYT